MNSLKISCFLITFILFFSTAFAQDPMHIEYIDFCAGLDVTFTLYNQTQWNDRDNLEEDEELETIDADVKVYDGPLTSMDLLYDDNTGSNGNFTILFDRARDYLIRAEAREGNFTRLEHYFQAQDCGIGSEEVIEPEDVMLDVTSGEILIADYHSPSNQEPQAQLLQPEEMEVNISKFDNITNIFSIEMPENASYSRLEYTFEFSEELAPLNLYSYDENNDQWIIQDEDIRFSPYSHYLSEPFLVILGNEKEEEEEEEEITTAPVVEEQRPQTIPESSNETIYIAIGVVLLMALLASPFLFKMKKNPDDDEIPESELNNYNETYEKTKLYVLQYKESFSPEAIRKSLEEGHVPKDIIDKVFREEY